ncbi:MAG: hypothetical protein IPO92_23670 [Saprospiraceae bacterium]|nr:hypothetical protein [Saprospiraceae bacterium]
MIVFLSLFFMVGFVVAQNLKPLSITFKHKAGSEDLILENTVFPIWNGKNVILKRAEFYLSQIGVYDKSGDSTFPDTHVKQKAGQTEMYDPKRVGQLPVVCEAAFKIQRA